MNHQPFEHSIFEPSGLSPSQQAELRNHLANCPQCTQLQEKWMPVSAALNRSALISPSAGFTARWSQNFARRRAAEQKKQIITSLIVSAFVLLVCSAGLYFLDISQIKFEEILVSIVTQFTGLLSTILQAWQYMNAWFSAVPIYLTVVIWVAITTTFCVISFFWFFSLWKLTSKGDMVV